MINMLDFNELDAAKPHVHGKKNRTSAHGRFTEWRHAHTSSPEAIGSSCANSSINNSER